MASKETARDLFKALSICLTLFMGLWVIPFLFAFLYYPFPTAVHLILLLIFLASLIPLWRVPGSTLAASLNLMVLASAFCGLNAYYAHVLPLKTLTDGREYTAVFAQQPSVAFADAAILEFAGNAIVDGSGAASLTVLEHGPQTYCVAPIRDGTSVGPVNFWAVGLNCCPEKLGSFECDSAGQPDVNTGVVVPDAQESDPLYASLGRHLAPAAMRRDYFLEAIRVAELSHDLQSSPRPLLVRWVSWSKDELKAAEWRSIALKLTLAFFVLGLVALLLTGMVMNHDVLSRVWDAWSTGDLAKKDYHESLLRDRTAGALRDFQQVAVLGLIVPYLTVMSSVILWSWMYCYAWGQVYLSIFVVVLLFTISSLLIAGQTYVYGCVTLLCAILGTSIGRQNFFANSFHYCAARGRRMYTNVLPDSSAGQFQDAGKMAFAKDAAVAHLQSAGFMYGGTTDCAAPIMSRACEYNGACGCVGDNCALGTSSLPAYTDFWAVGVDCCGYLGSFECDRGVSISNSTGVVLRDSGELGVRDAARQPYLRAVKVASDNFGLRPSEHPVLIQWNGNGAEDFERIWISKAILVILATAVLAFVVLFCLVQAVSNSAGKLHKRRR